MSRAKTKTIPDFFKWSHISGHLRSDEFKKVSQTTKKKETMKKINLKKIILNLKMKENN